MGLHSCPSDCLYNEAEKCTHVSVVYNSSYHDCLLQVLRKYRQNSVRQPPMWELKRSVLQSGKKKRKKSFMKHLVNCVACGLPLGVEDTIYRIHPPPSWVG